MTNYNWHRLYAATSTLLVFWICFTWSSIEAFKSKRHNTFRFTKSNSTWNLKHLIGWVYVSENPQFNESNFELDLLKIGLFNWSTTIESCWKVETCTVTCNLVYTYGLFGLYAFRLYTWNPKYLIGWIYFSKNLQFDHSKFEPDLLKIRLFNRLNNY